MLKITKNENARPVGLTIVLEGRLIGPWVDELARAAGDVATPPAAPVTIDLQGLTFADEAGVQLLRDLRGAGVEIAGSSGFLDALMGVTGGGKHDAG